MLLFIGYWGNIVYKKYTCRLLDRNWLGMEELMQGNIINTPKKKKKINTLWISLSCKLAPVLYPEYKYRLL